MARVNVDDRALSDPRFTRLGVFLGCPEPFAQRFGLGAMVRVWRECIERGAYELPEWLVNMILETPKGVEGVLESELGERSKTGSGGYIRIRGTLGRVEYLTLKREAGRQFGHLGAEHGKKGGRPRKPADGVSEKPGMGVTENPQNNPPPAPAPAPAPEEKNPPTPRKRGERPRGPSPETTAEVEAYEALSGHRANPAAIRAAERLHADGNGDELRKARDRYTRELDAKDSPREFRIKPHNWFGRAARWTEYSGPEPPPTKSGAYLEPKGARPKGNEAYTAAYWNARDQGKSNDEAVTIAKAAMREDKSA